MNLLSELTEIIDRHEFRTSNRDQRFLIDSEVIGREVELAELSGNETVLEIGTGFGFLTREIAKKAGKVITIERDLTLKPILGEVLKGHKNIEVRYEDALEAKFPKCDKIISNIPYSVSSDITEKILSQRKPAVLLVQKEFAEKMTAQPGGDNYRKVSAVSQFYSDIKITALVNANSFSPQPKIKSAIILCRPLKRDVDDSKFLQTAKELFRQKNKKVRNILKYGGKFADQRVRTMTVEDIISVVQGK